MKPIKINILDKEKEAEIQKLIDSSDSLEVLALGWIREGFENSFHLGNCVDGDSKCRYLVLTLGSSGEGKTSFAELYYDFSEAKKVFTAFPLYEDLVSGCW